MLKIWTWTHTHRDKKKYGNHPKLDHFSIETYGFRDPPLLGNLHNFRGMTQPLFFPRVFSKDLKTMVIKVMTKDHKPFLAGDAKNCDVVTTKLSRNSWV